MNSTVRQLIAALLLTQLTSVVAWSADGSGLLRVVARYGIGGQETGYDYLRLDPSAQRLFVAHATRVEVLDTATGKQLGFIPDTPGVHGVALAPAVNHGFTSNGADRTVTMFDMSTLQTLSVIRYTGVKPDAIELDSDTGHVFVVNGGSTGDITVLAADTGAIIGTVVLNAGKLEEVKFDGKGRGFVNDEARGVVYAFSTHTLQRLATWPLAPGAEPTGLAIDTAHHRLFAACGNRQLVVLDTDNGRVVATSAIGLDPDGAAFDSIRGRVYTSNRDGTLTVLHQDTPDRYRLLQNVPTEPGARTLALDAVSGRVYLAAAKFGPAPAATDAVPEPRAPMLPESFVVLVVGE